MPSTLLCPAAVLVPTLGWTDIAAILPALILFATGAVVLVVDLFSRPATGPDAALETRKPALHFLALLGTVLAGAQVCGALSSQDGVARGFFLDAVRVDRFALAMSFLVIVGAAFTLLAAADALRRRGLEHGEFHALVLFAAGSMVLFVQSSSLILVFLSLETLSMAVYILTAYTRDERRSVEGALKYFVLGGLSTGFLLFGMAFIYGATGTTNLAQIPAAIAKAGGAPDASLLGAGAALLLIGLGFKVGAFPFHSWVPDAYEGALSVVTGFMAVTVKVASFGVLLRFVLLLAGPGGALAALPELRGGLILGLSTLAVLTMVFGNVVAVVQTSAKRMLAYSAIAHTGYLLVGVVAAADASAPAAAGTAANPGAAVVFYLFPYALMTLGAFACMSYLGRGGEDRETISSYRGLSRRHPGLALAILLLMISFAGIPPTPGFWGKLYIFQQAIATGHWALALVGILTSIVSVYYYLSLVVAMYMQASDGEPADEPSEPRTLGRLAIALAVAGVVLLGFFPQIFFQLSQSYALR
jgi:NADH-quinone oxidoreductase subunit N